jgi:hypothetical protein
MPLIECIECGNHYPDRLTNCPKCGAQIHQEKKTRKQLNRELIKYLTLGLLLALVSLLIFQYYLTLDCFLLCSGWEELVQFAALIVAPIAFIVSVIMIIAAIILRLSSDKTPS